MLGMLFIVGNGRVSTSGLDDLIGIGYGLLAAVLYASLMLLNKFIKNMDGLDTTVLQLGTATILLVPYVFFTEGFGILEVSSASIPFILILGIGHTGIGFLLFFSGMQKLKGQSIAALSYADPITSLVISIIILQEQTTFVQLLGGALLLGSTFVSENKSMKISNKIKKSCVTYKNSVKHSLHTVFIFIYIPSSNLKLRLSRLLQFLDSLCSGKYLTLTSF